MPIQTRRGFTLIELLVVVAIIGILASVILASLNSARAKARDAKKIVELREVSKALALYYDKYGRYPNETPVTTGSDLWYGNFNSMATQLVTEGFLASVPVSPTGATGSSTYHYYNYLAGSAAGALLKTDLETLAPTTTPKSPSCRPFDATNWCSYAVATNHYCLCNPY